MIDRLTQRKILKALDESKRATPLDKSRVAKAIRAMHESPFDSNEIMKTVEVAEVLGITTRTVYKMVDDGVFSVYTRPGCKRWSGIKRESVENYLANSQRKKPRK